VLPARSRAVPGILAVALALAGCADFDNPAAAQGLTRNDLVAGLAAQLSGSASLTYAATYQLSGGATATIAQAQNPSRTAYRYPGGAVLVTTAATTRCLRKTCTMTAPPTPTTPLPASMFADAEKAGLVTPAVVQSLLNAARLDPDMTVAQHDTTIAGRHATCVALGNVDDAKAREFSTCITSDGVLGSFTGQLGGKKIDVAMTGYADRVRSDAFDPSRNATTVDQRRTR
jgi:hypothetical protein